MIGSGFGKALAAGILGACVVTVVHEVFRIYGRRSRKADAFGRATGRQSPDNLDQTLLDLAANSAYRRLMGLAGPERAVYIGAGLGLAAGLGAVVLPVALGLETDHSSRQTATQAMTVALYTTGGLIAGSMYRALD
jgi:hypothetical protein